jgi:hypothetical protein
LPVGDAIRRNCVVDRHLSPLSFAGGREVPDIVKEADAFAIVRG